MANSIFLATKQLTKVYDSITVLQDVSIDFYEGEVHALIGENGAGKSTLCKMLSGAILPASGEILIE